MWLPLLALMAMLLFLYRWYRQSEIMEKLSDKYVLITGCDSGFGNQLAKQLDRRGFQVLAACLTEKGAEDLTKQTSDRVQTVILDVSDSQSVSSAAKWATQIVSDKGLWGLVNNAGILIPVGPNEWLRKEDFCKILDVNLLGMIDVTLNLLPLIRKAKGRIVNVSSIAGRLSLCGGGYCISKFGVEAFSDSIRRELKPFGVKVSIINPDFFKTLILDSGRLYDNIKNIWSQVPQEVKDCYGQEYFHSYCKFIGDICSKGSSQFTIVTNCMEHALTAVHPWTRYSAGWYAKFFYMPLSYLPTCVADYMLKSS
ncbi:retinol dehydrogenase 7-like [Spea bombifrons]|uniref:retinol dehydrogenase 7-like n=1 Tax=Spea bombifrons TaxID=233779 RepID=UPI00234BDAC7|nr:retinol dehydrogenase 7-like [Spea bombifrons]